MKFPNLSELKEFIRENNLFEQVIDIKENFVGGGSSYNFKIRTANDNYFLKLTYEPQRYWHLRQMWQGMGYLHELSNENFGKYQLLAMPYIEGHKVRYKDINQAVWQDFFIKYAQFQKVSTLALVIAEQIQMGKLFTSVSVELKQRKIPFKGIILQYFMLKFAKQLVLLPKTQTVIHGDMTANNVMLYRKDDAWCCMLLDLENMRYGYEIEDICMLILGLCGFRGMRGSIKKFAKLYTQVNSVKHYQTKEWLYGIQVFYLAALYRRIYGKVNRKYGWRKMLCFTISLMNYFRLAKFLQKQQLK